MNTKRGLSDVVTTVLIILVALGAVGIIAGFLMPMIKQSSSEISASCFSLKIEPVGCSINATNVIVQVKRNPGIATLKELKLVFESTTGESKIKEITTEADMPKELETKLYIPARAEIGITPAKVSVAGVVLNEAGNKKVCDASVKIDCY